MIKHEELIKFGFELLGVEEDDPFYRLTFNPPFNFGIAYISGSLKEGVFTLYGNRKDYNHMEDLKNVVYTIGSKIRR
jgi:hypothetical protein